MLKKATLLTALLSLSLCGLLLAASSAKTDPVDEARELYNDGIDWMKAGDYAAAQDHFERALAKKEDFAEAHNNLGYCLRKQGEDHFEQARDHYDRAIELDGSLAEAYMYRGVLHALMGDESKALEDHGRLMDLDADLAEQLKRVIASGEEPDDLSGLAPAWQG